MTSDKPGAPVRRLGASRRVSLLELFFDLVYVAALALTSTSLSERLTWTGALHTLLPLMALWWLWSITTWLTDFYDPERLAIQALIIVIMLGSLVMATALPRAFEDQAKLFAITYVAVHMLRGVWLTIVLRGHEAQQRASRFFFWYAISGWPWIAGALVPDPTLRAVLWTVALAIEYVAGGFRYPTPWGRVPLEHYENSQQHVGERYQQFMILSLGELILVAALQYNRTGFGAAHTMTALAAFAVTVLFWQCYLYRAGTMLRGLPAGRPARVVRWAPYTHGLMIAGIVATASGFDLAIRDPKGATPASIIAGLFGGSALFLIGRSVFEYEVFGRLSYSRLAWLAVLIAVTPAMTLVSPVVATAIDVAILLGVTITDAIRGRRTQIPVADEEPQPSA